MNRGIKKGQKQTERQNEKGKLSSEKWHRKSFSCPIHLSYLTQSNKIDRLKKKKNQKEEEVEECKKEIEREREKKTDRFEKKIKERGRSDK